MHRLSLALMVVALSLFGPIRPAAAESLYVGTGVTLSAIDPATGADRFISLIDASALALSPSGSLYVGTGTSLYEVDPATGADRFISGINATALALSTTGSLYVGTGIDLSEVDAFTGTDRLFSGINATALAAVVPVPAAGWLFAGALGWLGWTRRMPRYRGVRESHVVE